VLTVLLSAVLLAPLSLNTASFSQQDAPPVALHQLELRGLSPLVLTKDAQLQLTGTLTNSSDELTRGINLQVSIGSPLQGRSALPTTYASKEIRGPQQIAMAQKSALPDMSPGQTRNFTISIDVSELKLGVSGVYPLKVTALSETTLLDESVITLPWMPENNSNQKITVLWPVTAPPAQSGFDTAFSDLLPKQMLVDGSLNAILESTAKFFTLVIDPAITDFAQTASDGYFITNGEAIKVGTDSNQIDSWGQRLATARNTNETWLTPYGNPEIVSRQGTKINDLLDRAFSLSQAQIDGTPRASGGVISIVRSVTSGKALVELAKNSDVVVLPSRLVTPSQTINYTPSARVDWASLGLPEVPAGLLIADSQISDAFRPYLQKKDLSDAASALMVRQQLASELTMIALERPSNPSFVLVTPPPNWAPTRAVSFAASQALALSPWATPVPLTQGESSPPATLSLMLEPADTDSKSATLRPRQIELVKTGANQISKLESITTSPSEMLNELKLGLNRSLSQAWVKRAKLGRQLATDINRQIEQTYRGISVVASPDLTLTGQLGALPVTITNSLDVPISVSLAATSTPGAQINLDSAKDLTVAAEQSLAIDVPIEVRGSVPNQIDLYLVNAAEQPVGLGSVVQLRTTAYSQIAQWISIISLALLVLFAAISLTRKVRKSNTKESV
jgi:hypothetical protein